MIQLNTIYRKILAFIITVAIIFMLLFLILGFLKYKLEKQIVNDYQLQFTNRVQLLLDLHIESLTNTLIDNTYWNDLVIAIGEKDTGWFTTNITYVSNSTFDYYAVSNSNFEFIKHESNNKINSEIIIPKGILEKVKQKKAMHFFIYTPEGLIEVYAGSIHPMEDMDLKKTQASGYLVMMKKWDQEYMTGFGLILGSNVEIKTLQDSINKVKPYEIQAKIMLTGWDGIPIASLVSKKVLNLNFNATQDIFYIIIAAVLFMLILFFLMSRSLIYKPLKLVTDILESDNQESIDQLKRTTAEYGRIGNLFEAYVSQKNELVDAKEKAEESDRLKSAFLANMSHEIRTPMNGILGFAGLLKEPKLSGEEQQEYIRIIEQSGVRMLNIINDIVSISKVESGQMEVSIKETHINEQIEYIYTFFKPEAEKKGIKLYFENSLPATRCIIKTDREKIYAILTNLVKNALKFTLTGIISFGYKTNTNSESNELEFYVKDSGVGINPEHQKIIFERFRQCSESLSRNYEGAGLGLAISRAFVEMLGGKMWVESEPGIGSTFYFTIPYNPESQSDINTPNIKSADFANFHVDPEVSKLKILIVEDNEVNRKLITIMVEKRSNIILAAKTGTEAVIACHNNPDIDLIFMDIRMPDLDGLEATRRIRQFNKNVIIIAQTAYALTGDREKAIEAGCNEYITKPINKADLLSLIQRFCKN